MKAPFRIRKHDGQWHILLRRPAGWRVHSGHTTQADAMRAVYRNWPWWP